MQIRISMHKKHNHLFFLQLLSQLAGFCWSVVPHLPRPHWFRARYVSSRAYIYIARCLNGGIVFCRSLAGQASRIRLAAMRRRDLQLRILFSLQHWDPAHHRLWVETHHWGMPRRHLCHELPERHRDHDPSMHGENREHNRFAQSLKQLVSGGHHLRQAVSAKASSRDASLQQERGGVSARWPLVSVLPSGEHALLAPGRVSRSRYPRQ